MQNKKKYNYDDIPGVKDSGKLLTIALMRKFYLRPKIKITNIHTDIIRDLRSRMYRSYIKRYRIPVDEPIYNEKGMTGVFLVASYTNKDKAYLSGMIKAADAFGCIILHHDKNRKHSFKYNESLRFQLLIAEAKRRGAEWILVGSPKTRFSSDFRRQIEPYLKKYSGREVVLGLKERYLWEKFNQFAYPKNVKGDAFVYKLFTVAETMSFDNLPIHASQHPINYKEKIPTTASRYYLGRFNIETMKQKAEFYYKKDGKDYSYLYDMAKPRKHNEEILGIGVFEEQELLGKNL